VTTYDIRVIDPTDETLLRAWWEVGEAATADRPIDAWTAWEVSRKALPIPRTDGRLVLVSAFDGERTVGAGMLFLFRHDNTHLAEAEVYVHPDHRRRGIGRALVAELERLVLAEGRDTVIGSAFAPVGEESPGSLFAAALGYPVASHEETKTVDLRTAPESWPALDEEVAGALGGYRVEVCEEHVPDEHVEGFCRLLEAFLGEIPTGDLDLRRASWTKERLREGEDRAIAVGRVQVVAFAIAPDGELCGFSDLRVNRHDPRHASVGGTLVLPGHRGHRLGLAMKLATHRRAQELFPQCAYVETGNAGVNAAMNAVNGQLGYRVVERCLDVQKVLA
jgi:GNAT superfamily N-acetyltransferase